MWIQRKVKSGQQTGRKMGYPTLNFNPGNFGDQYKPGAYACEVLVDDKVHQGALYFGPKFDKPSFALEIYILDYSGDLYSHYVQFRPTRWLRAPMKFDTHEALRNQIQQDLQSIVQSNS